MCWALLILIASCSDTELETGRAGVEAVIVVDFDAGDAPLAVQFSAAESTGEITEYTWDFGDGGAALGKEVDHTYIHWGELTATLSVSDGKDTDTDTVTIAVGNQPCPTFADGEALGIVEHDAVDETSGLIGSRANPGVLWVHKRFRRRRAGLRARH